MDHHQDASKTPRWFRHLVSAEDLRIPYTRHTTNKTVRSITICSPMSGWVISLRLRFFRHLAHVVPKEEHHCVIVTADWRRPVGPPRTTRLRTIDDDIQSLNFGVHTAWRKARDDVLLCYDSHRYSNAPLRSSPVKKKNQSCQEKSCIY